MRLLRFSGITLLILMAICSQMVLAGTTGKITGVVLDSEDKQPVAGARVVIDGTTMGNMVNPVDGSYVIQNVPPGTYTLIASCIGYNNVTVKGLLVHADVTTEQNFTLVSEAVKVGDVEVIAIAPEIDKYEVSSVDRISTKEIEALPVTDVQGIIKMQTGIVSQGGALHVRGSRAGELAYVDDGVLIRDNMGGYGSVNMGGNDATPVSRLSMNISSSDIEDISIMKGNYSAEYGDMSGGLVTTHRKEGSPKNTQVNLEYMTDDWGFSDLNDYSFNQDNLSASLSGPLPFLSDKYIPKWPGEAISYYASFYVSKNDGYVDYNNYDSPDSKIDYGDEDFLGIDIPNRRINNYAGTAKLTWQLDKNSRYKFNFRYTKEWSRATNFSYAYLYTPETATIIKNSTEIKSAKFSFTPPFLKNTFGEFQFSEVTQIYERRPGDLDPSDVYVPIEGFESYEDTDGDGEWDAAEEFEDLNSDGVWGEPFVDSDLDGVWDAGEAFTDLNNNGAWDTEPFEDADGDGTWDGAETVTNDVYYVDVNGNGRYDDGDSTYTDGEGNGNGIYDAELSDLYSEDTSEPYQDGDISAGEYFTDNNGNGVYDEGVDTWDPINDLDHNGQYTGPDDDWAEGIPYTDCNNNGRYDAPNNEYDYGEYYTDENGNGQYDNVDGFLDSGYDRYMQYHYDRTRTRSLKMDITSQVSRHHNVKSGFEFRFHSIVYKDLQYPYYSYDGVDDGGDWSNITRVVEVEDTTGNGIGDVYTYQTYSKGVFRDFYTRSPKDGSFYVQDNLEFGELIASLGMRYEFFIQAREVKDSVTLDAEGLSWRKIIDSQSKIAPRLGFSFPISEKAKLMFNYGHFYQRPGFYSYYQRRTQGSSAISIYGNPNLDYEKTILYEIGVQYAIAEGYKLDITGYFKDQYGLLNTVAESTDPNSADYQSNVDYARTRGLELELEKTYGQFLSGSIKYEYTFAYGKSSSANSDYYTRLAGGEISIKENPLDWDIRHQVTLFGSIHVNKGEHPHFGVLKLPDDWDMSISCSYRSGQPYTPDESYPGLVLGANESVGTNSERMPSNSTVDVGINKRYQVMGLNYTLKLLINNIFDKKNIVGINEETGLAYTSSVSNGQILTGYDYDDDPTLYSSGRQILFGVAVNF